MCAAPRPPVPPSPTPPLSLKVAQLIGRKRALRGGPPLVDPLGLPPLSGGGMVTAPRPRRGFRFNGGRDRRAGAPPPTPPRATHFPPAPRGSPPQAKCPWLAP